MFHFEYNFLVLVHLRSMNFKLGHLENDGISGNENEANSNYVLNQFLLGNIRFWTVSDVVCRSTSSFPFKSIPRSKICQNWITESQDFEIRISRFFEVSLICLEDARVIRVPWKISCIFNDS